MENLTPEEWIKAYLDAKISEGLLAKELKTHRLDARRQVQEYQERGLDVNEHQEFLRSLALQVHKENLASFFRALAMNARYLYYVRVQSGYRPEDYDLAPVGLGRVIRARRKETSWVE